MTFCVDCRAEFDTSWEIVRRCDRCDEPLCKGCEVPQLNPNKFGMLNKFCKQCAITHYYYEFDLVKR